ncbi:MAG TPA: alpha/beta fold hydrolase [Kofleriaceae bacterium]|nr:alpha/beta fold hydrolase [Kofleriaceae bacterium]
MAGQPPSAAAAVGHTARWFARWLSGAPSRWLGSQSGMAQDLAGGTHGLTYLRHLARGNRIRRRASFEKVDDRHPPVLLIHGFLGTRGSMYPLERRLADEGLCVFSFNLGALNSRDIRASAFLIHRKIESILSQTSVHRIDIVGHSMGGLIGLYYIKKLGGQARVRRLVMMGTPVRGTWAALAGVATLGLWSKSSWQLLPRSRFLDELSQGALPPEVDIFTLAAVRDLVCPLPSTRLRGATSVTVRMGHSSLVVSEEVFSRILSILRSAPRQPDARDAENEAAASAAVEEWSEARRGSKGTMR